MIYIGQITLEQFDESVDFVDPKRMLRSRPGVAQLLARARDRLLGAEGQSVPREVTEGFARVGAVASPARTVSPVAAGKRAMQQAETPRAFVEAARVWLQRELHLFNESVDPIDEAFFEAGTSEAVVGVLIIPQRRRPLAWGYGLIALYEESMRGYSGRRATARRYGDVLQPVTTAAVPWSQPNQPMRLTIGTALLS